MIHILRNSMHKKSHIAHTLFISILLAFQQVAIGGELTPSTVGTQEEISHRTGPGLSNGAHRIQLSGGEVWYYVEGAENSTAMLMLHGGPGGTVTSLYALADLADDYSMIFLDQPGTGRSEKLTDTTLMTMEYMVTQLHEFTEKIGLSDYILYGHSWGTMLALDYYLEYPDQIRAMIMNSPLVSSEMWMEDARYLISTLHDTIQEAVKRNESNKTYHTREYQDAIRVFYQNFINRGGRVDLSGFPKRVPGNSLMYNYMWGPSEFNATGTLKNYDRLDRLDELNLPVLWITGEYDEARPETVRYYHQLDEGSDFEVIPGAAHGTMFDNQADNVTLIRNFLRENL